MTPPRRRVLRPATTIQAEIERRNTAALRRCEAKVATAQSALRRWMQRLKRSFNTVDKLQRSIARLEKQLALLRQA